MLLGKMRKKIFRYQFAEFIDVYFDRQSHDMEASHILPNNSLLLSESSFFSIAYRTEKKLGSDFLILQNTNYIQQIYPVAMGKVGVLPCSSTLHILGIRHDSFF